MRGSEGPAPWSAEDDAGGQTPNEVHGARLQGLGVDRAVDAPNGGMRHHVGIETK